MQLIPRYLYKNEVTVVSNDIGFVVEYRPVYSRQLKVYKGVDNKIQFRMLNADQKPVDISGQVMVFEAFDEEKDQVLYYEGVVQDDGSTKNTKGMFYVTVTENDLLNLPSQYLSYVVYQKEVCDSRVVTYTNRGFDACGHIYVDDCTHPTIRSSNTVTNWMQVNDTWVAGYDDINKITAMPKQNKNEAVHTVQFYTDAHNSNGFVGDITIKGTLDNQITGQNSWATIDTVTFDGTETRPVFNTFNGVYTYLRFDTDTDPTDKIVKILVRN
jgi:hypothetical protein